MSEVFAKAVRLHPADVLCSVTRQLGGGLAVDLLCHIKYIRRQQAGPAAKQTQPGPAPFLGKMTIWDWKYKPKLSPENMAAPLLGNK